MVTTMIHNHADRSHSYELLAEIFGLGTDPVAAAHHSTAYTEDRVAHG